MEMAALMKRASCGVVLLLLLVSPAISGPLNGDVTAIPGFTGTTPFTNGVIFGTVDYAVYTYGAYLAEWGPAGYTPTVGEDVYTYQVILNPGSLGISHLSVHIENPADTPGAFTIGAGTFPTTINIGPGGPPSADFYFSPEALSSSSGVAFSSPNAPIMRFGSLVDGGTTAFVVPLPTPGATQIPDPATVTLFLAAALCGLPMAIRRFRAR